MSPQVVSGGRGAGALCRTGAGICAGLPGQLWLCPLPGQPLISPRFCRPASGNLCRLPSEHPCSVSQRFCSWSPTWVTRRGPGASRGTSAPGAVLRPQPRLQPHPAPCHATSELSHSWSPHAESGNSVCQALASPVTSESKTNRAEDIRPGGGGL